MDRSRQWDIFCKVIDNFGDIGVCWRLAADLASRGHQVRLWVNDASALAWMAPAGCKGVRVLPWIASANLAAAGFEQQPPDVLIEAFGCEIAPEVIAACARQSSATGLKPVWINLEYLSAEPYARRCHGLPSPVQSGPAAGWLKWFFYPGFTDSTGGLLREPGLAGRQADFDRYAWLATHGIACNSEEKLISLFCYEPPALAVFLAQLAHHGLQGKPVHLLVMPGRAEKAVRAIIDDEIGLLRNTDGRKLLSISYLPLFTQPDFDHLLWACELNFVRGEDSLVRALWAGKPFVWQVYPQDDGAHLDKLGAFLDMLDAPLSLRRFHAAWNSHGSRKQWPDVAALGACRTWGVESENRPQRGQFLPDLQAHSPAMGQKDGEKWTAAVDLQPTIRKSDRLLDLPAWQRCTLAARARLLAQEDLTSRLLGFVAKKR